MAAQLASGVSSRLATCALRGTGVACWPALRAFAVWPTIMRVSSSSSSSSSSSIDDSGSSPERPAKHVIPRHIVDVSHSRSSGPGGQNVNKVSTKVTLRMALAAAADFLPDDVLHRLREQQRTRLTKGDELVLQCDEERTQAANLKRAFARLQSYIDEASVTPKERLVQREMEPPERVKAQRRVEKRLQSVKKAMRRGGDD